MFKLPSFLPCSPSMSFFPSLYSPMLPSHAPNVRVSFFPSPYPMRLSNMSFFLTPYSPIILPIFSPYSHLCYLCCHYFQLYYDWMTGAALGLVRIQTVKNESYKNKSDAIFKKLTMFYLYYR